MKANAKWLGVGLFVFLMALLGHVMGQQPGRAGGMQRPSMSLADMDTDKDAKVTLDEFLEAHKKSLTQRFERMDRDHNKVLTEDELGMMERPSRDGHLPTPKARNPLEEQAAP